MSKFILQNISRRTAFISVLLITVLPAALSAYGLTMDRKNGPSYVIICITVIMDALLSYLFARIVTMSENEKGIIFDWIAYFFLFPFDRSRRRPVRMGNLILKKDIVKKTENPSKTKGEDKMDKTSSESSPPSKIKDANMESKRYFSEEGALGMVAQGLGERIKLRTEVKSIQQRLAYLEYDKKLADADYESQMAKFKLSNIYNQQEAERVRSKIEIEKLQRDHDFEYEKQKMELTQMRLNSMKAEQLLELELKKKEFEIEAIKLSNQIKTDRINMKQRDTVEEQVDEIGKKHIYIENLKDKMRDIWENKGYSEEQIEELLDDLDSDLHESGFLKGRIY